MTCLYHVRALRVLWLFLCAHWVGPGHVAGGKMIRPGDEKSHPCTRLLKVATMRRPDDSLATDILIWAVQVRDTSS